MSPLERKRGEGKKEIKFKRKREKLRTLTKLEYWEGASSSQR